MNWEYAPYLIPVLIFLVPIVAIVGGVVVTIMKKNFQHRERMAMIAQGIHPDYPPEDDLDDVDVDGKPAVIKEPAKLQRTG